MLAHTILSMLRSSLKLLLLSWTAHASIERAGNPEEYDKILERILEEVKFHTGSVSFAIALPSRRSNSLRSTPVILCSLVCSFIQVPVPVTFEMTKLPSVLLPHLAIHISSHGRSPVSSSHYSSLQSLQAQQAKRYMCVLISYILERCV